jgi:hypothetical protein
LCSYIVNTTFFQGQILDRYRNPTKNRRLRHRAPVGDPAARMNRTVGVGSGGRGWPAGRPLKDPVIPADHLHRVNQQAGLDHGVVVQLLDQILGKIGVAFPQGGQALDQLAGGVDLHVLLRPHAEGLGLAGGLEDPFHGGGHEAIDVNDHRRAVHQTAGGLDLLDAVTEHLFHPAAERSHHRTGQRLALLLGLGLGGGLGGLRQAQVGTIGGNQFLAVVFAQMVEDKIVDRLQGVEDLNPALLEHFDIGPYSTAARLGPLMK